MASTSNIKKLKELLGVEQDVPSSQVIGSVEGKKSMDEMEMLFSMKNSGKVKQIAELFNPDNKKDLKAKNGSPKVAIAGIFKVTVSPSLMNKAPTQVDALATPRKKCPPPPVPPKKIQSQKAAQSDDNDKQTEGVTNSELLKSPAYLIGDKITYMPKEVLVNWNAVNKEMRLRGKKQSKGKGKGKGM